MNNIVSRRLFSSENLSGFFDDCDTQAIEISRVKRLRNHRILLDVVDRLRGEFKVQSVSLAHSGVVNVVVSCDTFISFSPSNYFLSSPLSCSFFGYLPVEGLSKREDNDEDGSDPPPPPSETCSDFHHDDSYSSYASDPKDVESPVASFISVSESASAARELGTPLSVSHTSLPSAIGSPPGGSHLSPPSFSTSPSSLHEEEEIQTNDTFEQGTLLNIIIF